MNTDHIRSKIFHYKQELRYWEMMLKKHQEKEYQIRRARNLEVESDRKDIERAHTALEKLRGLHNDD